MSYGTDRLAKLGITTSEFSVDDAGNLVIHYTDIYGQPIPCLCENPHIAKQLKQLEGRSTIGSGDTIEYLEKQRYYKGSYTRLRLAEGDIRYLSPSKEVSGIASLPFYPLEVVQAYRDCAIINTLYLTEGELKAKVACMYGAYTVAFAGISLYKTTPQLLDLLVRCKVEQVFINYDADCTHNQDRENRAHAFFASAAKLVAELYNAVPNLKVFLCVTQQVGLGKQGLDDLLLWYPDSRKHLNSTTSNAYFGITPLGLHTHLTQLQTFFGLSRYKKEKYGAGLKAATLTNHAQTLSNGGRATNLRELL